MDELGGHSVEQFGLNIGSKKQILASTLQTHPLVEISKTYFKKENWKWIFPLMMSSKLIVFKDTMDQAQEHEISPRNLAANTQAGTHLKPKASPNIAK